MIRDPSVTLTIPNVAPRGRFITGWMLMTAWAFVLLVLLGLPLVTENAWTGSASIPLEFLVLDSAMGRPISGASVRLAEGDPEYRATTGPDGRAKPIIRATTGGRSGFFGCHNDERSVNYGRWARDLVRRVRRFERRPQEIHAGTSLPFGRGPSSHRDSAFEARQPILRGIPLMTASFQRKHGPSCGTLVADDIKSRRLPHYL